MKKIFIITGEHSGDIHAGCVAQILKESHPQIEIQGIGGDNLKNAGVTLFCDHSKNYNLLFWILFYLYRQYFAYNNFYKIY